MTADPAGTTPGVVGNRLVQALEQFLDAAARRDDHMVKLLTVMAKLIADSDRERTDLTPVVAAIDRLALIPDTPAPPTQLTAAYAETATIPPEFGEALNRLAAELGSTTQAMREATRGQTDTTVRLTEMVEIESRRLAELERKQFAPVPGDSERQRGLLYAPYEGEELKFLKESEVFGSLAEETLRYIVANGSTDIYATGRTIFSEGDTVSGVYIIRNGVVEVGRRTNEGDDIEVMAYLTAGDSIGEMYVLLPGYTHNSTARVPERAEVLVLRRDVFMMLFRALPDLALRLATLFAQRHDAAYSQSRAQVRHREIKGSFRHFRLVEFVRNLLAAEDRAGVFRVFDATGKPAGEFVLDGGHVRTARMGRLIGEEAFYQLLQTDFTGGSFAFIEGAFPEDLDEQARVITPGSTLLYRAAALADELRETKKMLTTSAATCQLVTDSLQWGDDETREFAAVVWDAIGRGKSIGEIVAEVPRSEHAVYQTLARMLGSKIIALAGEKA